MKVADSKANGYRGEYIPLVVEARKETFLDKLKACLFWLLENWRKLVRLLYFWVR